MTPSPVGRPTRGTTGVNRLRRIDRWIARHPVLRRADDPLVVDLGFGASAVTPLELLARLRSQRPDAEVLGLEIDPDRVARAREQSAGIEGVSFARGGFEVPVPRSRRPAVIRAMNVLRQYDEGDVADAWGRMCARLQPDGILVEGTCDEIGRIATWAEVGADAVPRSLTLSLRLAELDSPAIAAERLPKALIHRNVEGERVHEFVASLDREWTRAAVVAPFGPVHRWRTAMRAVADAGWPLLRRERWRLGEVGVAWEAVAPR
ncbi:class I SAM-dependent methyltransferase [Microbacterium sp. SL62]|uniref:class I SAM-dependent methyltransferase n=1 Tax=Microbacterium sp. SL62 TaxID=2995139 RepID=UPI0022725D14|nr:class I SAM-dependent methyltransferase [Microbacterium sp. SL62]MCY1717949.1 class I SAM-dependent methyltransferase [Microbacterium sp. SL62]